MRKSIQAQLRAIMHRKEYILGFILVSLFTAGNFISNVFKYQGQEPITTYMPIKLTLLANAISPYNYYFVVLYPLLLAFPVCFTYLNDRKSREIIYLQSKMGVKRYFYVNAVSVFLANIVVFTLPLLLEVLLSYIAFPSVGSGDPSGADAFMHYKSELQYFFPLFYKFSPILYMVCFILLFGIASGVLALFVDALSMFGIHYKIFLLLPMYLILRMLPQHSKKLNIYTAYDTYIVPFNPARKSFAAYMLFLAFFLAISAAIIFYKSRKDSLV